MHLAASSASSSLAQFRCVLVLLYSCPPPPINVSFHATSCVLIQAQIAKTGAVHLAASLKSGAFFVALLITGASSSMPHALVAYGRIHEVLQAAYTSSFRLHTLAA